MEVKKRDGRLVEFDADKILESIKKAALAVEGRDEDIQKKSEDIQAIKRQLIEAGYKEDEAEDEAVEEFEGYIENGEYTEYDEDDAVEVLDLVLESLDAMDEEVLDVDIIQDITEKALMIQGHAKTAKEYILFRARRNKIRDMNTALMRTYEDITFGKSEDVELKRENANIDGDSSMGTMLRYGSEGAKQFNLLYMISPDISKAHKDGDIHIHDLDFYALTLTCCQIDLEKLFTGGFNTGHGFLREPGEIRSYAALSAIAIQSNQNDMHGGQSIPAFDHYLAPGVAKTFNKQIKQVLEIKYNLENSQEIYSKLKEYRNKHRLIMNEAGYEFIRQQLKGLLKEKQIDELIEKATELTENETYQAMEAFIHNMNTLHSRAGAQVPFSSINFGTDTSTEGRFVSKYLLQATDDGLGQGETPIFPISIFKVKTGVNFNEDDPNYDLFKQACRVSAKRLFPNFSNMDVEYNRQFIVEGRPETEVTYMGCRTRVIANVHDKTNQVSTGRGNLSFTSINLPRIGLLAGHGNIDKFYELLDDRMKLVKRQILERLKAQSRKKPINFPFLMGQGIWQGSDELGPYDDISEIIKHGTLSFGFIGLAETLVALTGKHHGESEESQKLGLEIIGRMKATLDQWAQEEKLNYTLLATPAEGLSGRFVRLDKKRFGVIPGVTDKDYYTNSSHVPVYFPITAVDKINIEAPYHALENAGHICYIELDGDPLKNIDAFEKIVKYMHNAGVGYGAINHPVDRDPVCGYVGIIDDECPRCGRRDGEPMTEEMWDKVKKYAASGNSDNTGTHGNVYEEMDRVSNPVSITEDK